MVSKFRYNSELNRFEGYNGANWLIIKGVEDLDANTKVTAENTEGGNDDTIRFVINNATIVDVDPNKIERNQSNLQMIYRLMEMW